MDYDKLQPPPSPLLAWQAATGSHTWGSAHARLCCRAQLTQVLLTSVPGAIWAMLVCGAVAICSQNINLCHVHGGCSISLLSVSVPTSLGRSHSGSRNNHPQRRVSSSLTSLSWTRDFFNQVILENHHHTIILSALVKIR